MERRVGRLLAVAALLAIAVLGHPALGGAQPAPDDLGAAGDGPLLVFSGARLEGGGPWTSWFGAPPDRVLLASVGNIGDDASDPAPLDLVLERGMRVVDEGSALVVPALAPGETATLRIAIELPAFAIGTYGVEGSVPGMTATGFRAETTHVPWVLVFVPALVLLQLALVGARNRVRRRLHREATAPADDGADPARTEELSTVIEEELAAVFGVGLEHAEGLGDAERAARVGSLCREVTVRVAHRVTMTESERMALGRELTLTMLGELGLADATGSVDRSPSVGSGAGPDT